MRRWVVVTATTIVSAVVAALFLLKVGDRVADRPKSLVQRPTLYCEFYNFTHNATVVSFNFAVRRDAAKTLSFAELFVVEPDGTKTDHGSDPPRWIYGTDEGTPVITSPDSATRIVLYGLKAGTGGVFWTEAGVRSNSYRNLEGKCRQAHLDKIADAKAGQP